MRTFVAVLGLLTIAAVVALPDGAARKGSDSKCGKARDHRERGYEVIFDGSRKCFERWRYAGGSSITLQRDGTLKAAPGPPNLGVLWYAARPYGDFSLRLQFRDDSP